ncbi:winged helix domain-containing protein, partial [Dickeya dadantii]|nr:cupin domain-containing protein [Dickeya dadantii]
VVRIGDDCFVNGEHLDSRQSQAIAVLAQYDVLDAKRLGDALDDPSFLAQLTALVNSGYWYFVD